MSDDPYGLGIEGLGYGGFAAGFSANGIDLSYGLAAVAAGRGAPSSSSSSSSFIPVATAVQRRKLVGDLVELLKRHRGQHSFADFAALSTVDLRSAEHTRLLDDIKKNTKIALDERQQSIAYKVAALQYSCGRASLLLLLLTLLL